MTDSVGSTGLNEAERLTSLLSLGILDTPPQRDFDEVGRLAALACGTGSAGVTLVDADRVWFKSRLCVDVPEVPREQALCSLEIDRAELLIIPDTWLDERCAGNPLIEGESAIRFYAGAPLFSSSGHCVGRLCVFDSEPREGLTDGQREALGGLARIATELMDTSRFRQIGRVAAKVADVTSDAILCADARGCITSVLGRRSRAGPSRTSPDGPTASSSRVRVRSTRLGIAPPERHPACTFSRASTPARMGSASACAPSGS